MGLYRQCEIWDCLQGTLGIQVERLVRQYRVIYFPSVTVTGELCTRKTLQLGKNALGVGFPVPQNWLVSSQRLFITTRYSLQCGNFSRRSSGARILAQFHYWIGRFLEISGKP